MSTKRALCQKELCVKKSIAYFAFLSHLAQKRGTKMTEIFTHINNYFIFLDLSIVIDPRMFLESLRSYALLEAGFIDEVAE